MGIDVHGLHPRVTMYRSSDPDCIENFWVDQIGAKVSFDRIRPAPAEFRFTAASMGPVAVGRHVPHLDFRIRDEDDDFYLFTSASTGYTGYEQRGARYFTRPDHGVAFAPGAGPPDVWSGAGSELSWLRIVPWALERHLEELLGRPVVGPVALAPMVDLRQGTGQAWFPLFTLLVDQIGAPGSMLSHPLVAGPLFEAVLTGMLLSIAHPYRELLSRPARMPAPRSVKRAIDAIEAHPERPYTAATLARQAGVSVRSLQAGFRANAAMTPMRYLREVRLSRVHVDLRYDGTATVAQIANRWGFTHLGRFAAAYASRYGAPPSRDRRAP